MKSGTGKAARLVFCETKHGDESDSIAKATADAWRSDAALNVVQRESEKFKRASQDGVDENAT